MTLAQEPASSNLETDAEARKEKIDEILTDMTVRRDRLLKRFAVVLHGEYTTVGGRTHPLLVHPMVMARVVDKKREFDLQAMYLAFPDLSEVGDEIVTIKGKTKYRDTATLLHGPYQAEPEGMTASEKRDFYWNRHAWGHDPFDDYVRGAYALKQRSGYQGIELAMKRFKLTETSFGVNGSLVSRWSYEPLKDTSFQHEIEFSQANEWMPVRFSSQLKELPHGFQECRYRWKKHNGFLLPDRIQFALGSVSYRGEVTDATFKLHWLVGDEVPDEIFTAEDHLAALLDHFEIPHTRVIGDLVIREPHPIPDDLYEDLEPITRKKIPPQR